jgi:tetratricopeptide (TPR) repeat protein
MYELLKECKFEIPDNRKLIGRVTWDQMHDAIIDFFRDQNIKSKDTLLMYFSGHGIPDGRGDHYLATSEIDPYLPEKRGFRFDDLNGYMDKSISKRIVLLLDCCYSGAASINSKSDADSIAKSGGAAISNTLAKGFKEGQGRYILASSLSDQSSYQMQDQPYSLFTYYLLEGLGGANGESVDENGNVTPYYLGEYVYKKITDLPPDKRQYQEPIIKTEARGEIILAKIGGYAKSSNPTMPSPIIPNTTRVISDLIREGNDYFSSGNFDEAIRCYEKVKATSPSESIPYFADAWVKKGIDVYAMGLTDEALKCYDKAIGLNPNHVDAWYKKGNVLMTKSMFQEAIICYTNALRLNPNYTTAWNNKGVSLFNLGKFDEATLCYDRSLAINERDGSVWYNKGLALNKMKKPKDAERCFAKASEFR